MSFRSVARLGDVAKVRGLVERTGLFTSEEIEIAAELVEANLTRGLESGYELLFLEEGEALLGYTCFGRIAGTEASFDLYWIAVERERQRAGLGRLILEATERSIFERGGRQIFVDTSGRPDYLATRRFYEQNGYEVVAVFDDFYREGDAKVVARKRGVRGR